MANTKLDGTSDYEKLKKEYEELKLKKKLDKDSIIAYISDLEDRANANINYREKRENYILKKRNKNALKFIENAVLPIYKNDVEILKKILMGDD